MMPAPHKFLICPLSYLNRQIFLSIEIFDILRVISLMRADVFPTVHALHDLDHQIFPAINIVDVLNGI